MPRSLEYVQSEIVRVAEEEGLDPRSRSFTRTTFLGKKNEDPKTDVTKHDLEAYGGFSKVKYDAATAHGFVHHRNQTDTRGVELRNNYVRKLERTLGTRDYLVDKLAETFEQTFKNNKIVLNKKKYPKVAKGTEDRILTLVWSDLHFGVDVKNFEVYGNSFDWTIASRRMARLCEAAVEQHSKGTHLRILLNGDIMQGVIHLNDANIKPMTEQIWGAAHILVGAIDYLRTHFEKVTVVGLPGNHDRMTYRDKTRSTTQRWDSHAHSLYLALRLAFRDTDIRMIIPTTGIAVLDDLNGGYMIASHGDTEPDPKNVSSKIDTASMATKLLKMKESQALDRKVSVAVFGHWHTPTIQMLPTGSFMVVNGCLIGSEPYGQNVIGEYNNQPSQVMFESVVGNPFNCSWVVKVGHVDDDDYYDQIIEPPVIISGGNLVP